MGLNKIIYQDCCYLVLPNYNQGHSLPPCVFYTVFERAEHKQPQGVCVHFLPKQSHYLAKKDANKTDKHPSLQHACDMDAAN